MRTMVMADIPNYEDMIQALYTFAQSISDATEKMAHAGNSVVSGTNDDESAVKANEKIQSLQSPIRDICKRALQLARELAIETEGVKGAKFISDSFENDSPARAR